MKEEFEDEVTEENEQIKDNCMNNLGYFIAYKNLFSTWVDLDDFSIENVTVALRAFDRYIGSGYKKVFEDIFSTLSTRLTELGTTDPERTKNSKEIIKLVKTIPTDNREDYDVLGFIYEYLLKNFAANAGKAGEFYTPHEVSIVMAEIIAWNLKGKEEIYAAYSENTKELKKIAKEVRHISKYATQISGDDLKKMSIQMFNILKKQKEILKLIEDKLDLEVWQKINHQKQEEEKF